MIASEWNALQSPNNKVLGYNGVLNRDDEIGLPSPSAIGDMAAWYDATDFGSMVMDASANVSLLSDVSGQSGAVSGDSYLELPGTSGAYASSPDSAALSITGDIDIRAEIRLASWASGGDTFAIAKFDTTSQLSYYLAVRGSGLLRLSVSPDGTNINAINSDSTAVTGYLAGDTGWIRATRVASSGLVTFYTSSNGIDWTQLGDTVANTSGAIYNTTSTLNLGTWGSGTAGTSPLAIYQAQIYNGIDGTLAFDADFTNRGASNQSFPESSSNAALVTINGSARITHLDTENCLVLPGVSYNLASTPDSAALSITGDIEIQVDLSMDDWTPTAFAQLVSKAPSGGNLSYWLSSVNDSSGRFLFHTSSNGTAVSSATSSTGVAFANHSRASIKVTRSASTGDVNFYTKVSGGDWTQLGTTVSTPAHGIYDGTSIVTVGGGAGGTQVLFGKIYRAQIYDGIAGTLVFDANFTAQSKLATSFTESSSNAATVTINSTAIALPARIQGARDLYMGTAASQPKYLGYDGDNYGYLNGVSGNYFSTPDSAAVSITGDLDLRVYVAADDYTPAAIGALLNKMFADGQRSYDFYLNAAGTLALRWSEDGTALKSKTSTAAVPTTDRAGVWLRVTLDVDNGAGGNDGKFYTSSDGSTWTQLGSTVTTAGVTSIYDGTSQVSVGNDPPNLRVFSGKIYQAQIYDGIDGTLAAEFNADDYPLSGGSTFFDGASTPALVLDGTSGNYASAPDSAALSITGDIDLRVDVALNNWVPAGLGVFIAKDGSSNRDYNFFIDFAGRLRFMYTTDGLSLRMTYSSVATGFADFSRNWVRVTYASASGKVNFYTSSDGSTWTQLGSEQTILSGAIHDGTAALGVGDATISNPSVGKIYRAQVYDGIDGTLAFDADFSAQGSNTTSFTESSANAATVTLNGNAHIGPRWTINGGATIVDRTGLYFDGTNDYLKSAAFSLSQPENVYGALKQITWTLLDNIWDGNSPDRMGFLQYNTSSPNLSLYAGSALENTGSTVGAFQVISTVYNSTASSLRINRLTASTGNAGTNAAGGFIIGSQTTAGTRFANIFASEILIYDTTAHDTMTQDRLVRYLARKGSIDV